MKRLARSAVTTGAVLFAGLVASASDLPLAMLRFASVQTRSVEEWRGTARALGENPGCCHDVWRKDERLRERWHDFSVRSLAEVATVIARSFRKVSPTTQMGLQTSGSWRRQNEIIVRALAAATGEKVSVRLGGGAYYDLSPYEQIAKTRQMARACASWGSIRTGIASGS